MKPFPRRLVCLEPCPLHFPRLKSLGHQHQWSTWSTMPSNGFIHRNYALIWNFPKLGQLESQKTATSGTKNVHVHSGNISEIPWQVESQAILIFNKLLQVTVGYVLRFEPHVEANGLDGLADCAVALPQLKHRDPTALEENSRIWNSAQYWNMSWSFVSFFLLFDSAEVSLSSLVCRMGLHPTLPGPGLPSQFCTTMTRFIDIKQLAHHPVAAQGQEVGCLRWSHRLHLGPPPANQQPIYLQSQQSNQSPWASCFVQ